MHRRLVLVAIAACSAPAPVPVPPSPPATAAHDAAAPGLRLPGGATPLAYDLHLEVDPASDAFVGHVAIRVRLDAPTDHVWLSADKLAITSARWDGGALVRLPNDGDQMIAFGFGRRVAPGEVTLAFDYTGETTHDEEGLFHQQAGGRWYLFSQGEATFARRIAPCFDEPRWKTPWRVTLDVPAGETALANMPVAAEHALPDGRREVAFAETPPIPSYLVAIAVGPFAMVDIGALGRGKIPVRVAALAGQAESVRVVARTLPAVIDGLETYLDDALPWPKLDLVVVPRLFGAMENPGLVTFAEEIIAGDPRSREFAAQFVRVSAHELAHFWFGDLVTPAWWDDLWLSESFASWLGDLVASQVGASSPEDDALGQRRALEADAQPEAQALHRAIASNADPDAAFGPILYDKGRAVLAMFEAWNGHAFRAAVRAYVRERRGGTATAEDFIGALARATDAETGAAFADYIRHAGVPAVDVQLDCTAAPKLVAHARDHVAIPACFQVAGAAQACAFVGEHTELPLATCPAWVLPSGYFAVAWTGARPPDPPLAALTPDERVALGEDVELGVLRGELPPAAALGEVRALAGGDLGTSVAAAAIARAIDPLIADGERPAWQAWLAARFAPRLVPAMLFEPTELAAQLSEDLVAMIGPERLPPAVRAAARARISVDVAHGVAPIASLVLAAGGDRALFERVAGLRDTDAELLGAFDPDVAPAAIDLALGARRAGDAVRVIAAYLHRAATRTAVWSALRPRVAAVVARLEPDGAARLVDAIGELCDAAARAQAAAAFAPLLDRIVDGRAHLDRALASIDRCIAARARAGDLGGALQP